MKNCFFNVIDITRLIYGHCYHRCMYSALLTSRFLAGQVFAGGVNEMGDIEGHHALAEAYEMGKAVL